MTHLARGLLLLMAVVLVPVAASPADEPLHVRIDALIAAQGAGRPASPPADDAEFLRRVSLDLAGRIPSAQEVRAFLADPAPEKRAQLIERLLAGRDYPRRMQELFHVLLMERLGDHPEWTEFLRASFEANLPWDRLVREILAAAAHRDGANPAAAFFVSKRLENYGQNPVDYPALTRDVGRLFLGIDLRCAQCHDHLFIPDYTQQDFQGLSAFFQNTSLADAKAASVAEKPTTQKLEYASVFNKVKKQTGPRIPGAAEVEIPAFAKGEEYVVPPDPKKRSQGVPRFSPLSTLAERLPTPATPGFTRNIVNRLWCVMMGRGLVHPPDLHHSDNPPSHPELLDLLAVEFEAHHYDIKWLLRELALSQTYQRSSLLPEGRDDLPRESFLTANEKRLSAEQLLWSMLEATGPGLHNSTTSPDAFCDWLFGKITEGLRDKFVKVFANAPREPEEEFSPSLKTVLFVLNDEVVFELLTPQPGNLVDRLMKSTEADQVAEELYLSVLSRPPAPEERAEVAEYLARHADRRATALGHLAWALLASTEFCVNH